MKTILIRTGVLFAAYFSTVSATLNAQTDLSDINQWNYINVGGYGSGNTRYTSPVSGLFESTTDGITIKTNSARGAGEMMSKQSFSLAGSTLDFTWSGNGGSSYSQVVLGELTTQWDDSPGAVEINSINASFGNSYNGSWVASPGRVYQTQLNISAGGYSGTTKELATGNVVGTQSGSYDFSTPLHILFRQGDTYDYQNSYLALQNLQIHATPPTQNIVLDFDDNAPFTLVGHTVFNHSLYVPVSVGSMAAAHPDQQYRTAVLNEVRSIFASSGVTNVNITDTPTSGATTVYFASSIDPNLLGQTLGAPDRFNKHPDGTVAVFVNNASLDAETAAHEIGHTLGLRHVNPGSTVDPTDSEVMDYDFSANPKFINAVSPIFDITAFGATHNPLYHLKRYVDNFTDAELRAQGINPGTWDLQQPIKLRLGFTDSQRMLFNVNLLVSSGAADSLESIAHYDQITLEALQALEFDIDPGMALTLLASSTSSGPLDVALATGDPYAQNNLFVQPVDGQVSAFLQFQSGTDTYTTLDTATVTGTVVPEPSTALLIGVGFLGLVIIQRRNRHLTMRCSEPLRTSRPMLPTAFAPSPPSPAHRPRRAPRSLSLGSLGD